MWLSLSVSPLIFFVIPADRKKWNAGFENFLMQITLVIYQEYDKLFELDVEVPPSPRRLII